MFIVSFHTVGILSDQAYPLHQLCNDLLPTCIPCRAYMLSVLLVAPAYWGLCLSWVPGDTGVANAAATDLLVCAMDWQQQVSVSICNVVMLHRVSR